MAKGKFEREQPKNPIGKKKIKQPAKVMTRNANGKFDEGFYGSADEYLEYLEQTASKRRQEEERKKSKKFVSPKAALLLAIQIWAVANGIADGSLPQMFKDLFSPKEKFTIATTNQIDGNLPTIEVDGKSYEIDQGSYAVVQGELGEEAEGTYSAWAYDTEGNFQEGEIDGAYLDGKLVVTENQLEQYNIIYQMGDGTNTSLEYGEWVLGTEPTTSITGEETIYVIGENENGTFTANIAAELLQRVDELPMPEDQKDLYEQMAIEQGLTPMRVDIPEEDGSKLNLRTVPDEHKMYIMTQIPNGSTVYATGEITNENGRDWTEVKYITEDGYEFLGWVATEYLTQFNIQLEKKPEEQHKEVGTQQNIQGTSGQGVTVEKTGYEQISDSNIIRNKSGNITGIDVSTMTPNQLRALLQSGIPKNVETAFGDANTSQIAGPIQFVYMKLGASAYGNGQFKIFDYDAYKGLVEVCEEFGVDYGFYYYSTAVNIQEAHQEAQYIENAINDLKRENNGMPNNSLGVVIDVELSDANDRQYGKDVTDAKAYIIRYLQEKGISDRVIMYCPGRIGDPKLSDKIIDWERLVKQIPNREDFAVWLCSLWGQDGKPTQSAQKYFEQIESYGIEVVMQQGALDVYSKHGGRYDANNMDYEYYWEIVEEQEQGTTDGNLVSLSGEQGDEYEI